MTGCIAFSGLGLGYASGALSAGEWVYPGLGIESSLEPGAADERRDGGSAAAQAQGGEGQPSDDTACSCAPDAAATSAGKRRGVRRITPPVTCESPT